MENRDFVDLEIFFKLLVVVNIYVKNTSITILLNEQKLLYVTL